MKRSTDLNLDADTQSQKPTIVLFLGVEGVLLDKTKIAEQDKARYTKAVKEGDVATLKELGVDNFSKEALETLRMLIGEIKKRGSNCGIVLSSSWRAHLTMEQLKALFAETGLSPYFIGKTADHTQTFISLSDNLKSVKFELNRAELCETWYRTYLKEYNIANFLIFDF